MILCNGVLITGEENNITIRLTESVLQVIKD